jgi:glycosyltransferase involved in cell wall biosynthesis
MQPKTLLISHYGSGTPLLYLQELINAFERKRYPVTFYLPKNTCLSVRNESSCRYVLTDALAAPPFMKVKVLKYPFHMMKYIYNAFAVTPEKEIKAAHLLNPFYLTDNLIISRLKRNNIKVILTVHEVYPHKHFLGGAIDRWMAKKLYNMADVLVVHTESLKRELEKLLPAAEDKIHVVPHGYFEYPRSNRNKEDIKRELGIPLNKIVLLAFGSVRDYKGIDILLEALKGLEKNYMLLVAGESAGVSEKSPDYYKRFIEESGIQDRVLWINRYISEEDIPEIFAVSDAIVLPYRKTFHAQSGVLNLAIGYERPCVVSDVGGLGETVREYNLGIVVEPENVEDLRRGIHNVFENMNTFDFSRYKNENSWGQACNKLIKVYEELLEK